MKRIEEIKTSLEKLKPVLKKQYQVEAIGVFGSFARGEQKPKSDIDILVEFSEPNTIDLFDFIKLEKFLSQKLGIKVRPRHEKCSQAYDKGSDIKRDDLRVKRTYKLYLNDILEAIERIENYTKGLNFEDFSKNSMIIDAVTRNFEIIGEAAKQMPAEVKKKQDQIPWKEMAGMRDKLTHNYSGVNIEILWKTAKKRVIHTETFD